jgi:hypothetical protein
MASVVMDVARVKRFVQLCCREEPDSGLNGGAHRIHAHAESSQ